MNDEPSGRELMRLAVAQVRDRAAAGPEQDTRYQLLLAARAAEIAWRDRALEAARLEAERAVGRAIREAAATEGFDDNPVAAIRSGSCDGSGPLHGALLAMTAIAASITRPDLPSQDERRAISALVE